MAKIIGIDLGTTNSVCGIMEGGEPAVVESSEGGRLFPSVVAINPKTGERIIGQVARRQAITNPENTIFSIKRFMGRKFDDPEVKRAIELVPYKVTAAPNGDVRVWMGGKEYSPPEVSAMILQKIKKDAEDYLGEPVADAVILLEASRWTCLWRAIKRRATIDDRRRPDAPSGQTLEMAFLRYIWQYPKVTQPFVAECLRQHGHAQTSIRLKSAVEIRDFLRQVEQHVELGTRDR